VGWAGKDEAAFPEATFASVPVPYVPVILLRCSICSCGLHCNVLH
jgi:hypothetical protein